MMHCRALWATNLQCLPAEGFELRPVRDHPILQITPQRDRQAPGKGHNADAPQALAPAGEASGKPLTQLALGLMAQPAPSELHHEGAHPLVAGLGNALLGFVLPARVGRGREPQTARHFAPVTKAPPAEELLHQHPAAANPDRAQLRKPRRLAPPPAAPQAPADTLPPQAL